MNIEKSFYILYRMNLCVLFAWDELQFPHDKALLTNSVCQNELTQRMTRQFDQAFLKKREVWRWWSHWKLKDHTFSLLCVSLMALCVKLIVLISLLMQLLSWIRVQSAIRWCSFCYSEHFIRASLSSFISFVCALDGGLPCEVSEGQWSCNCERTASVGNISLMGKMQEERKITQREHLHFNEFLLILCMAWVEYWFSAGGMYELTETANILTGSL